MNYEPETGVFTWRVSRGKAASGKAAGHVDVSGYIRIRVKARNYSAHRLAWLHTHGHWPSGQIDHINGNRDDNRLANLRDVTAAINQHNRRKVSANNRSTGLLGVGRVSRSKTFEARIRVNGESVYLGSFKTPEAAHEAYVKAKRELHEGSTL
jgi:hypothetical protein